MADGRGVVSEAAQMVAEVATDLPGRTRTELVRLLGHSVAMPTYQELREMRLGLLVELISETGELPTAGNYDRLRDVRNEGFACLRSFLPALFPTFFVTGTEVLRQEGLNTFGQ